MIRSLLPIICSLLSLVAVAQQQQELQWKHFESLEFGSRLEDYSTGNIFFYHAFVKNGANDNDTSNFSFTEHAKPLDLHDYWTNRGDEQYHVLMTKVAYVLDKPVEFFSEERLSDPGYIARTIPEAMIK